MPVVANSASKSPSPTQGRPGLRVGVASEWQSAESDPGKATGSTTGTDSTSGGCGSSDSGSGDTSSSGDTGSASVLSDDSTIYLIDWGLAVKMGRDVAQRGTAAFAADGVFAISTRAFTCRPIVDLAAVAYVWLTIVHGDDDLREPWRPADGFESMRAARQRWMDAHVGDPGVRAAAAFLELCEGASDRRRRRKSGGTTSSAAVVAADTDEYTWRRDPDMADPKSLRSSQAGAASDSESEPDADSESDAGGRPRAGKSPARQRKRLRVPAVAGTPSRPGTRK